jgi:hypothetical protein
MHWAYLITIGKLPYRDFFYYIIPFFQWLMVPVFLLRPDATVLILARVCLFFIYAANAVFAYRIAAKTSSNRHIGLLAAVIFAAFPMTFDKTIEVRPDMVMVLLYLLATDLIITTKSWSQRRALILGCIVSADIMILPKIIFAMPALLYLFLAHKPRPKFLDFMWAISGGLIPAAIFLIYLIITNTTTQAFVSIIRDSVAVNTGKIPFSPWKVLSPYPLIYVSEGGPSLPWQVNSVIWILSGIGLFISLVKKPLYGLFFAIYFVCGILFLFMFPAPYTQYFLPLSAFAAILAANAIFSLNGLIRFIVRSIQFTEFMYLCLTAALIFILVTSFRTQYIVRIGHGNTNDEQVGVINDMLKISKDNETAYDMVG